MSCEVLIGVPYYVAVFTKKPNCFVAFPAEQATYVARSVAVVYAQTLRLGAAYLAAAAAPQQHGVVLLDCDAVAMPQIPSPDFVAAHCGLSSGGT